MLLAIQQDRPKMCHFPAMSVKSGVSVYVIAGYNDLSDDSAAD